ncbi:NUDIX hydrolase [Gluconobacter morbifer]|uniref:Putative thiamin pyrophosphokinase n=1 Tax=Gluconobacter morbifer G707 TaxID=1088869 RepID=G6XIG2_9PROT|nr:NUDIX domain-containing protein [Gluconobacter morbifer]EHH68601.1 putative thiamin pyrophosphokinase [Gluconobacter morbifer G707]
MAGSIESGFLAMRDYDDGMECFAIVRAHAKLDAVPDETSFPALAPFMRHIRACNDAVLPGDRKPFFCGSEPMGWVTPETGRFLAELGLKRDDSYGVQTGTELSHLSRWLCDQDVYASHHEDFDVRSKTGVVLGQVDRGAIPVLGVAAEGVHLNGLVERPDGTFLWIARRSRSKRLDPGKLDHLVAGGISAGLSPDATVIKEAQEEAGIPDAVTRTAQPVSRLQYALERPEGLRRDILHCYDLVLPPDFVPVAEDGEVESFHLLPLQEVFGLVRDTDDFKFNVNLVLIDLFVRRGLFSPAESSFLQAALTGENQA